MKGKIHELMKIDAAEFADKRLQMTVAELVAHIKGMTYFELLWAWRHAPKNDPFFINEIGETFKQVMRVKRLMIFEAEASKTSKLVGKGTFRGPDPR